jgi:hypothetical protein
MGKRRLDGSFDTSSNKRQKVARALMAVPIHKLALPIAQHLPGSNQQAIAKVDQPKQDNLPGSYRNTQIAQERSLETIPATSPPTSATSVYITPPSGYTSPPHIKSIKEKVPIYLSQSPTHKRAPSALLQERIYIYMIASTVEARVIFGSCPA